MSETPAADVCNECGLPIDECNRRFYERNWWWENPHTGMIEPKPIENAPTSFREDTSQLKQQSSPANGRADAQGGGIKSQMSPSEKMASDTGFYLAEMGHTEMGDSYKEDPELRRAFEDGWKVGAEWRKEKDAG